MAYQSTSKVTNVEVGYASFHADSLTNSTQTVSSSKSNLYSFSVTNPNGGEVFVKFYDGNSTVGTDTPVLVVQVPANEGEYTPPRDLPLQHFDDGIEVAVTTGATDADSTAPTSNITIDLIYA